MAYKHTYPGLNEINKYFSQVKSFLIHLGERLSYKRRRTRFNQLIHSYGVTLSYFNVIESHYQDVFKVVRDKQK